MIQDMNEAKCAEIILRLSYFVKFYREFGTAMLLVMLTGILNKWGFTEFSYVSLIGAVMYFISCTLTLVKRNAFESKKATMPTEEKLKLALEMIL